MRGLWKIVAKHETCNNISFHVFCEWKSKSFFINCVCPYFRWSQMICLVITSILSKVTSRKEKRFLVMIYSILWYKALFKFSFPLRRIQKIIYYLYTIIFVWYGQSQFGSTNLFVSFVHKYNKTFEVIKIPQ